MMDYSWMHKTVNSREAMGPNGGSEEERPEHYNTDNATMAAVLDVLPETPLPVVKELLQMFPGPDVSVRTELVIRHLLEGNDFSFIEPAVNLREVAHKPGFRAPGANANCLSGISLDNDLGKNNAPAGRAPSNITRSTSQDYNREDKALEAANVLVNRQDWNLEEPRKSGSRKIKFVKKSGEISSLNAKNIHSFQENSVSNSSCSGSPTNSSSGSSNGDVVVIGEAVRSMAAYSPTVISSTNPEVPTYCGPSTGAASSKPRGAFSRSNVAGLEIVPAIVDLTTFNTTSSTMMPSLKTFVTNNETFSNTASVAVEGQPSPTTTTASIPSAFLPSGQRGSSVSKSLKNSTVPVASCSTNRDSSSLPDDHPEVNDAADATPPALASTVPLTRQQFYEEKSSIIVDSVLSVLPGTPVEIIQELMQAFPNGNPGACADSICRHLLENMDAAEVLPEFQDFPLEQEIIAWPQQRVDDDCHPPPAATMDIDLQGPHKSWTSEPSIQSRTAQKRKLPLEETSHEDVDSGSDHSASPRDGSTLQSANDQNTKEDIYECNCCYNEVYFEELVQCAEGHLFCAQCLRRYAEESVYGQGQRTLLCMQEGCDENFPASQLMRALPETLRLRYEERIAEEVLNMANLENLIRCPFCNYQAVLDEGHHIFVCPNPECEKRSCRDCGVIWEDHEGLRCHQIEKEKDTKLRTDYEEKMANARIRTCPSCKAKFTKESGCNRITCRCGKQLCYICRQPINGYDHFCQHPLNPKEPCEICSKTCFLWTDAEYDDHLAISEIKKEASEARIAEGFEDGKEIGAPSSPEREHTGSRTLTAQLHVQLHRHRLPGAPVVRIQRVAHPHHPHHRHHHHRQQPDHLDDVINAVAQGFGGPLPEAHRVPRVGVVPEVAAAAGNRAGQQNKMHNLDQWQALLRNMQQEVQQLTQEITPFQQQQTRQRLREMAQRANRLASQPVPPNYANPPRLAPPVRKLYIPQAYRNQDRINELQEFDRPALIHAGMIAIDMQRDYQRPQAPQRPVIRQPPVAHVRQPEEAEPQRWPPPRINPREPRVVLHNLSFDTIFRRRMASVSKVCNPEAVLPIPLELREEVAGGGVVIDPRQREARQLSGTLLGRDELDFLKASPKPMQVECLKTIAAARKLARQKRKSADKASLQDLIETYGAKQNESQEEQVLLNNEAIFQAFHPFVSRSAGAAAALGIAPPVGQGENQHRPATTTTVTTETAAAVGAAPVAGLDRVAERQHRFTAEPWNRPLPRHAEAFYPRIAAAATVVQEGQQPPQGQNSGNRNETLGLNFAEDFWGSAAVGVPAFEAFNDPNRLPVLARTLNRVGQTAMRRRTREVATAGTREETQPFQDCENGAQLAVQDDPEDLRAQSSTDKDHAPGSK